MKCFSFFVSFRARSIVKWQKVMKRAKQFFCKISMWGTNKGKICCWFRILLKKLLKMHAKKVISENVMDFFGWTFLHCFQRIRHQHKLSVLWHPNCIFLLQNCFVHISTFLNQRTVSLIFNHLGALSTYLGIYIRVRICKRLRSPGIHSNESNPPAYVACTANRVAIPARQTKLAGGIDSLDSIPGVLKSLQTGYICWRNCFHGIVSGLLRSLKIRALDYEGTL
jgi:hypothetical protein